ncbi:MAG: hypothetical protein V4722_28515 [Bacteroidota bacterium]
MKNKSWIVFRVTVYLCLAMAMLFLIVMIYFVIREGRMSAMDWTIFLLIMLIPIVQISFQSLNAGLLHHCLPNNTLPGSSFRIWHSVLLALNMATVVLIGFTVAAALTDLSHQEYYGRQDLAWQYALVSALIIVIIFNFYTIVVSLQLRNYLRTNYRAAEEQWLNNIGKEPEDGL